MLRLILLMVCVLGASSCGLSFCDEWRKGKLYVSLFFASILWGIAAFAIVHFWSV